MLAALELKSPDHLGNATEGVFRMIHCDDRDSEDRALVTEERLQGICEKAGLPTSNAKDIVDSINSPAVKDLLKANISEAVSKGAYGAPFYTCDDQVYFGSDRLGSCASGWIWATGTTRISWRRRTTRTQRQRFQGGLGTLRALR